MKSRYLGDLVLAAPLGFDDHLVAHGSDHDRFHEAHLQILASQASTISMRRPSRGDPT
jgi:hypothetical protein